MLAEKPARSFKFSGGPLDGQTMRIAVKRYREDGVAIPDISIVKHPEAIDEGPVSGPSFYYRMHIYQWKLLHRSDGNHEIVFLWNRCIEPGKDEQRESDD